MKKSQSLLLATTSFTADAPAAAVQRVGYAAPAASCVGLLTGVLIIGVLNNALQLLSLGDYYQMVVKGVVLLAAVGFDTWQTTRKTSKRSAAARVVTA